MAHVSLKERLATPTGALIVGLVLAAGLMACPATWTAGIKGGVASLLRPGQTMTRWLREQGSGVANGVRNHLDTAAQLAETQQQNARLKEENRRLTSQIAMFESQQRGALAAKYEEDADQRLLKARGVRARVLGHAARSFLGEHHLLDIGSQASIRPDSLIVELPGLIDQGTNVGLKSEQLVLSQGRVWGKVVEVGSQTSTVRRVTEPGYRDIVRLATPGIGDDDLRWGPQGIIEGTGERLARIRLIEVTEPVAVGDQVYTAAAKGLLPEPLLYGRIVAVERPVGAAHWDLWMEPAVAAEPEAVVVLRAELNGSRAGERTEE
jgi:cell shape-determining protein MreC